jgi:hypothetical protein
MQRVSRQRIRKHFPAATNTYATIELLLETMFSTLSVQRDYNEGIWDDPVKSRVEAGSNTSTVALRVVGGDEKGTQCLGVQPGNPVPGGAWPFRLGESPI